MDTFNQVLDQLANSVLPDLARVLVILLIGIPLVHIAGRIGSQILKFRLSEHQLSLARKIILYLGYLLILVTILAELGYTLTAVLGAAGVATIAIGFAAQTSLSNFISGLFLYGEQPFKIGDIVRVGEITGIVMSIDLLSVKIRTFDNLYVRVPNESLIKTQVTNITHYPIRRLDLNIGVAYKEDLARVTEVLKDVADKNPLALVNPEPIVLIKDFSNSSVDFLFGVWFEKSNFFKLKNSIMIDVKKRFNEEGIEIPFPHMTLYSGSVTEPFPVRVAEPSDAPGAPD